MVKDVIEAEHTELALRVLDDAVERIAGMGIKNDARLLSRKDLRQYEVLPHLTDSPEMAVRHSREYVLGPVERPPTFDVAPATQCGYTDPA